MKLFIATLIVLVALASSERPKSDCEKHRESVEGHETIMKLIPKCKPNGDYEALQCYEDSDFCVCYNGKGHAVSPIKRELKYCECYQKQHDKIKWGTDESYIPQCDKEGAYAKKQCWPSRKLCWCADKENKQVGNSFDDDVDKDCD